MKKIYLVVENNLEYDDQYYTITGGYNIKETFTNKSEADLVAKQLDDQEKQNIKIEETWLYEVYEEYPENKLMFYKVVELEIPEK